MIRAFCLLVAALSLGAAAPARDWRTAVGIAPGGGFTAGNPAAKVRLVEYLSFTCPHCAHFAEDSRVPLHDAMVRGGSVQTETRSAVRDPYDLAAWMVARCGGPQRFAALSGAIFAAQETWLTQGAAYAQANTAALTALPQHAQIAAIADRSGLAAIGAKYGVTPAALKACLATDAQLTPVLKMTEAAFAKISGTPGFEINGTLTPVASWSALEPLLRAAGAR